MTVSTEVSRINVAGYKGAAEGLVDNLKNQLKINWETPAGRDRYLSEYYHSTPQRYVLGTNPYEGKHRVKRRIYLIQAGEKIRAIALGFRTEDREAIEEWADNDAAALNLELDPAEVEVRFLTPQVQY